MTFMVGTLSGKKEAATRPFSFLSRQKEVLTPGFEIWFCVVKDIHSGGALWIRYSLLRLQSQKTGAPLVRIWGAFFDSETPRAQCWGVDSGYFQTDSGKTESYQFGPESNLSVDHARGRVTTGGGVLRWDLKFGHQFFPFSPVIGILQGCSLLGTQSRFYSPFAKVSGNVEVSGTIKSIQGVGTLSHIWGTKRVDELYWIFVPTFDGDSEGWGIELVFVKPGPWMPFLVCGTLRRGSEIFESQAVPCVFGSKIKASFPRLSCKWAVQGFEVEVDGLLNLEQVVPYVYRNPDDTKRFIAQSDVSSLVCKIRRGDQVWNLTCKNGAALEFHGLKPWTVLHPYLDGYKET